ncbi:hypothetical protein B0H10DRAFT_1947679 [Mycena sp. CBHHK59/15]|nr:hypothetical protein B0H10DRAFT_1947679 [Mycena sp. CBHHK59/15]
MVDSVFQDNEHPLLFNVPVPAFPWFHPKDCSTITTKLALPCVSYDILDPTQSLDTTTEDDDEWVTTSMATKVKPGMTLNMCSPHVKICLGLRTLTPLSTPRKHVLSVPEAVTPTPTLPKSLPGTPSPLKRSRTNSDHVIDISDSEEDVRVHPPLLSLSSALTARTSGSLSTAPRGKRTPWPLQYTCDMDAGFKAMDAMEGKNTHDKFCKVFGGEFEWHSSTFSDSWRAWTHAPQLVLVGATRWWVVNGPIF